MLGDRRLVIVLRAERLLKPRRAGRAAGVADDEAEDEAAEDAPNLEPLEEYLDAPVDSTALVFVAAEMDRTRRLTKKLIANAVVVTFGGLSADGPAARKEGRRTAEEWLRDELTRAGKTIDPDAARLLVARAGHDITKLRGDVERLLLYAEGRKRISSDDVMETVAEDQTVEDEWGVVNAIADGNPARALAETGRRLERGDSPHQLLGQLRWWVSTRLAEADESRVKAALDALLRTDLALKSSGGDDRVLVERLVVELTGRPLARPRGWR
jgi:DNA polymerase-3 subunit delta